VTYDDAIKTQHRTSTSTFSDLSAKKSFFKNGVHWEDGDDWTSDGDLPIERDLFGLVCDHKFEKQISGIFVAP
jgi:hypothetical protein